MRIVIFLVFLMPLAAWTQPVEVRSGEHADFSRLVFMFAPPVDWSMGREEDAYRLHINGPERTFELSRVFDFIPRERISRIHTEPGGLRLVLGCDCTGIAFEIRPGVLVVDVKDGPPGANAPFERPLQSIAVNAGMPMENIEPAFDSPDLEDLTAWPATPSSPSPALVFDITLPAPDLAVPPSRREPKSNLPGIDLPVVLPQTEPDREPGHGHTGQASVLLPQDPDARVDELRTQLVLQLSRAASQGLIEPPLALNPNSAPVSQPIAAERADATRPTDPADHINFRTSTQVDRDQTPSVAQISETVEGHVCLTPELVAVPGWGAPGDPISAIAGARRALFLEFDRVDRTAALALAQAYIHAGFGAEARLVLSQFSPETPNRDVFLDLARLVDGDPVPAASRLYGQISCDGPVAFWAALATQRFSVGMEINDSAVIAAFNALPLYLRRHLGPALAEKFVEIRDLASAHAIRNAIARAEGDHGSRFALLEARLDNDRGDASAALNALQDIAESNDPMSPEALARYLSLKLDLDEPIDQAVISNAAALIYEHRGTSTAEDLGPLVVRALSARSQFRSAIETLGMLSAATQNGPGPKALWPEVLLALTNRAKDGEFLRLVFSEPVDSILLSVKPEVRRRVADRLLELRLPEKALSLLPDIKRDVSDRKRRARAALMMKDSAEALLALTGLGDPEAEDLRGRAYRGSASLVVRNSLHPKAGTTGEERAGRPRSSTVGEPVPQEPPASGGPASLSEARALLENSRSARNAVTGDLLEAREDPS